MTKHPSPSRTRVHRALIFIGILVLASAARESFGDELTKSNVLPSSTSPSYATVTLTQKSTNVVEFKVTPNKSTEYKSTGATFGVTKFTFDTSLTLAKSDFTFISPTAGCDQVQPSPLVPFGQFTWMVTSSLGANPLVFDVTHTGAVPSSFEIANANKATFSAFIGGFTVANPSIKSQWVSEAGATLAAGTGGGTRAPTGEGSTESLKASSWALWVTVGLVILAAIGIAYVIHKKGRGRAFELAI